MKQLKLIIAGGGTGGHIFPAIAIANAVKRLHPDCEILFVGAKGKMEMEKIPAEGFKIIGLDIAGFNRSDMLKNLGLPIKLIKSFMQARKIIREFQPDVAVGVGGYASFPVLYMAQQKGVKTLIQEQNSFAGKSNQWLGKKANSICVAYENMDRFFPKKNIMLTGNPVRSSISKSKISRQEGIKFFNLDESKKIVFAFGGSLGAKSINETLINQFQEMVATNIQLIWQTGSHSFAKAMEAVKGFESQVKVFEFIREMDYAYAAADIIVARSGASSVSELAIVGKPVVFIPFPFASEDHQTCNAKSLVDKEAASLLTDAECRTHLINRLITMLNDETLTEKYKNNIKVLAITDADTRIANKIIELAT